MAEAEKTRSGFCINCDNKHGCKSKTPPCIALMTKDKARNRAGKEYLIEHGAIDECATCPFLRSCWDSEAYEKALRNSGMLSFPPT